MFSNNPGAQKLFEKYEKNKNLDQLFIGLKSLISGQEDPNKSDNSDAEEVKTQTDVLSSPFGNIMNERKKFRQRTQKNEEPIKIDFLGNSVKACDEGLSPKIVFKKKNNFDDSDSD